MNFFPHILYFRLKLIWPAGSICLLLFVACAQVVRPVGGKTDSTPPTVISYLPENKSLNFNSNSFTIKFDEYFTVKDVSKQWIISPPLKVAPDYKIKGKTLIVSFSDTLKENTTYNFNFGRSIADVNEGNELIGLSYILSTGNFIDSLRLTGNVTQALNNSKEKEVLIMLYQQNRCTEDSFPYIITPDYFSICDASGNYVIDYIKPGRYYAVALKDANSNYLFDSFDEPFGFCDSVIDLKKNTSLDFKLFKEIEEKIYLKNKFNSEYGCFSIMLNKALHSIEVIPLQRNNSNWALIEKSKFKDTVNIYLNDFTVDSIQLAIKANGLVIDTVEFPVLSRDKFSGKNKRVIPSKLTIKSTPQSGSEKDLNTPVTLAFNHPLTQFNTDRLTVIKGKEKVSFELLKQDEVGKKYHISCSLMNDSAYKIIALPGAFTDCFGNKNDTLQVQFKVPSIESTGNLYLSISADSTKAPIDFTKTHLILQLLNDKGELLNVQKIEKYQTCTFLNLKPGTYKAQMIIDANNNGLWDTGKWLKKQQPERIIFMNSIMNLRANWDLEEDWKISLGS